jgi:hypothetical protein
MTSRAVKMSQNNPAKNIRKIGPDRWAVPSRRTGEDYAVARYKTNGMVRWSCGCPATVPACYHIISVIIQEAKGLKVSFWTDGAEASRQKRKQAYRIGKNHKRFWITYRKED